MVKAYNHHSYNHHSYNRWRFHYGYDCSGFEPPVAAAAAAVTADAFRVDANICSICYDLYRPILTINQWRL